MVKSRVMRILLTNDDGYRSDGINALLKALLAAGHDVVIVAPELNSSGAGQSIAVYNPFTITQVNERIYYVSTTPADSVRLGLQTVYGESSNYPDLVISGINHGENIGEDVLYSGTVGAAREAAVHKIPGIAVSTPGSVFPHLDAAAKVIVDLVNRLVHNSHVLQAPFLWNINIPNKAYAELGEFETTKLGTRGRHLPLERYITPYGCGVYWQGLSGEPDTEQLGTDVSLYYLEKNISITPLGIMATEYDQMPIIAAITAEHMER